MISRSWNICLTITKVDIFQDAAVVMVNYIDQIRFQGFEISCLQYYYLIKKNGYLSIGGGLAIDYYQFGAFLCSHRDHMDSKLVIEPRRSLFETNATWLTELLELKPMGPKTLL